MTRVTNIDANLISSEMAIKHLQEIEYKYLWTYTNINNIKAMIADIKREMNKEWVDLKTLNIALDEQNNLLATNVKASKLHKKNIEFLVNNLNF